MARPRKDTVSYFPHDTDASLNNKRTIPALQTRWGNDGYAFWFKLLEFLGLQPGLYFDYNDPAELEFLRAQTNQNDTETVLEMLKLLSTLRSIDSELHSHKIIWCQEYTNRVAGAFHRAASGIPERPKIELLRHIDEFSHAETIENTTEMPQRKLKEIKLKEIKRNKGVSVEELPEWIDRETWDAFLLMRKKAKAAPTDKAQELLIKDLEKFRAAGDDPNEVLNQSIKNGWKGLFPLKNNGGNGNGKNTGYLDAANGRTQYTKPPVPFVG